MAFIDRYLSAEDQADIKRTTRAPAPAPTSTPAPAPYVSKAPAAAPVAAPVAKVPELPTVESRKFLDDFELDEISAALAAISGQYGMQRTGLVGQQSALRRAYEMFQGRLGTERDIALERSQEMAGGSGRLRSGGFLRGQTDIASGFAQQLVDALRNRDAELSTTQQALGGSETQENLARAARAREIAREMLGSEEAIAEALKLV